MALEPVVEAGGSLTLQVDLIKLTGALGVGNEAGLYAYYYHGGAGSYSTINRTRVGTTAQQKLVVPTVASASGVIVVGDAATLVVQQFQVFPSGPIVGEALRVWFVAPKADGTVSTTAPTAVWSLDGSADSSVTVVAGANAGFWYVDLTEGQTDATSGRLLVTGAGVIPTSIPILFTTTASGGGGGGTGGVFIPMNPISDYFALQTNVYPPISKLQSAIGVDVLTAGSYTYETADGTLDTKNFNVGFDPTIVRRVISGPGVIRLALGG